MSTALDSCWVCDRPLPPHDTNVLWGACLEKRKGMAVVNAFDPAILALDIPTYQRRLDHLTHTVMDLQASLAARRRDPNSHVRQNGSYYAWRVRTIAEIEHLLADKRALKDALQTAKKLQWEASHEGPEYWNTQAFTRFSLATCAAISNLLGRLDNLSHIGNLRTGIEPEDADRTDLLTCTRDNLEELRELLTQTAHLSEAS